jgi:riboflavin kinase/FMN adenylyltransferase
MHNVLCAALGDFDGVHLGHRKLLKSLKQESDKLGLEPCVFTFKINLLKTKKIETILYNDEDKIKIFEEVGISTVIFADFDSISQLSPESFVNEVLIRDFGIELAIAAGISAMSTLPSTRFL